jgi:site-specific recombinase XerC
MPSTDLIELYLCRLAERGCTDATLETYGRLLDLADRRLPFGLDQANEDELCTYLFRRSRPLSAGSRRTYHTVLNCFYEWAVAGGVLQFNPMAGVAAPKVVHHMPRAAEDHQVRWVLTQAADPYRLWGTLAAFGNLRCIEISRLHREHISAEAITVIRGKGDKPRIVPTHPLVWAAVGDLGAGPVTDQSPRDISIGFWKYCKRSGMREMSMHRLRGWYATEGYAATNDLLAVQRNMGHTDPRTTAGYIRTTTDQARAVVDGLPTFGVSAAAMRSA